MRVGRRLTQGQGIPEGSTVYVMVLDKDSDPVLWNASTGRSFKASDPLCTLREVSVVAGPSNLWANVQREDALWKTSFNLSDLKVLRAVQPPAHCGSVGSRSSQLA